ncbi:hypothetical protein JXD38_07460 [candidate division WOR-3 bacterium]|nr:hypothetical protein [candidate division WOR-3 bacterium]
MMASAEEARTALEDEVRSRKLEGRRQNGRPEELVAEIEPRGKLVRVNLRPMLERGGGMKDRGGRADAEWLVEVMVESARRVERDPKLMKRRLTAAVRWCRKYLPAEAAELERLSAQAEESGYPAFHHSPAYTRAYRPAYRVILSDCLKRRASGREQPAGRLSREAVVAGR